MHILYRESLQSCNTLALAGRARAFARVGTDEQLLEALAWAGNQGLAVVPLGEGSNVVIAGDLDALVLRLDTRGIERLEETADHVVLRVAAGESWHALVQWTLQQGLYGLENLALIPGTVGAAPIQNIGAYGVELAPFVQQVHCLTRADAKPCSLAAADCRFGYRDSIFKRELQDQLVVTAVDLRLSRRARARADYPALAGALAARGLDDPTPLQVFETVVAIRRSRLPDPAEVPNAGSFFKNPVVDSGTALELARRFEGLPRYPQGDGTVKLPAAWLIEYCGWKGHREDGLGVHPEHALVIVNYGNGDGRQLLALAARIASSVRDTFGIELEIEPRVYGGAA